MEATQSSNWKQLEQYQIPNEQLGSIKGGDGGGMVEDLILPLSGEDDEGP